ncbi:MAG: AzlD domain-containing protein [Lachnospiraceae bacterium]|nr:AzlD domain-containing protein [Lachnospiraceae bacterium]
MSDTYVFLMIVVMAVCTFLTRVLPFLILRKRQTPAFVTYLGQVLPYPIMGMLIVYCLKDVSFLEAPFAVPELIAVAVVVVLHVWKRNTLLSIIGGTACYMILIQFVF